MLFTTLQSNRLLYVLQFMFAQFAHIPFRITHSEQEFTDYSGAKLNYSHTPICNDEIHIIPSGFLEQTTFVPFTPAVGIFNHIPVLFPSPSSGITTYHFDVFSAVFYMLSRYEEYGNKAKDTYGRFPAKQSLAYQHHFLQLPVVDIWLTELLTVVQAKHAGFHFDRKTNVSFTYDVDVAYAYKGREMVRQAGSAMKDVLRINPYNLAQRTAVLAGYLDDPFDTYDYIRNESIAPLVFFLLSHKKTKYDRNIHPQQTVLQSLVKSVAAWCPVGIHPSYFTSQHPQLLKAEISTLSELLQRPVSISRQHYLRFSVPHTFRQLLANGISEDYSMAYAETPGFRAGTCTPFYFFDVETNEATSLLLFPACIMESTFRDDIIIPVQEALPLYIQYFEAVNKVKGHFISIWHNDTLAANNKLNFRWLHQQILQYIRSRTR